MRIFIAAMVGGLIGWVVQPLWLAILLAAIAGGVIGLMDWSH